MMEDSMNGTVCGAFLAIRVVCVICVWCGFRHGGVQAGLLQAPSARVWQLPAAV